MGERTEYSGQEGEDKWRPSELKKDSHLQRLCKQEIWKLQHWNSRSKNSSLKRVALPEECPCLENIWTLGCRFLTKGTDHISMRLQRSSTINIWKVNIVSVTVKPKLTWQERGQPWPWECPSKSTRPSPPSQMAVTSCPQWLYQVWMTV